MSAYNTIADGVHLSCDVVLTSEDLEKYENILDWVCVSQRQMLSSEDLEKYKDLLNWDLVSQCQKLSSKDLEKYKGRLDWEFVSKYQKLSNEDLERFKHLIDFSLQERHHKEKSLEQKKAEMAAYAEHYGLYFDGKVLRAYRNHDQWGRGAYNKTISYEKGKYYRDFHVDMDPYNTASFGLGIWPRGNTLVEISVEDWGLEVPFDKGKCRVWGFKVL